jgi:hypothetical protein
MPAPFARASAVNIAESTASQMSGYRGASAPLGADQLQRDRVTILDVYDSRWQRDPGRANGPYS